MRVHPSDSLSLQSGKSPLHRSSPAGFLSRWSSLQVPSPISERPVTPCVESTKPHSLSQPLPGYYDRLTTRLRSPAPLRSLRRSPNLRCAAVRSAWYVGPDAISNAIGYAEFFSRSHDAVIRVYDAAGNVIGNPDKIRDVSRRVERDFKRRSGRCGRSPSDRRRVPLRGRTPPRARA